MKKTGPPDIDSLITTVRGQKVILDADLARIYHVPTKALNQAVKRNRDKFPDDFIFTLTPDEAEEIRGSRSQFVTLDESRNQSQIVTSSLRSQIVTSNSGRGGRRYAPFAFTEHGAIMAANVLSSPQATQMSVFVVRAFVKMRSAFGDSRELARKLALLEQELKIRLNIHEAAIVDVLQRIMKILDPPPPPPEPSPPEIGFHVKEEAAPYRIKRKGRS
jgi:hypothetical protein